MFKKSNLLNSSKQSQYGKVIISVVNVENGVNHSFAHQCDLSNTFVCCFFFLTTGKKMVTMGLCLEGLLLLFANTNKPKPPPLLGRLGELFQSTCMIKFVGEYGDGKNLKGTPPPSHL